MMNPMNLIGRDVICLSHNLLNPAQTLRVVEVTIREVDGEPEVVGGKAENPRNWNASRGGCRFDASEIGKTVIFADDYDAEDRIREHVASMAQAAVSRAMSRVNRGRRF